MKDSHRSNLCRLIGSDKKKNKAKNKKDPECNCLAPYVKLHHYNCPLIKHPCPIHGRHAEKEKKGSAPDQEDNMIVSFHPSLQTDRLFQPVKDLLTRKCSPDTKISFQYYSPTESSNYKSCEIQTNSRDLKNVDPNVLLDKAKYSSQDKKNQMKKLKHSYCLTSIHPKKTRSQISVKENFFKGIFSEVKKTKDVSVSVSSERFFKSRRVENDNFSPLWYCCNKFEPSDGERSLVPDSDFLAVTQHLQEENQLYHKIFEIKHKKGSNEFPYFKSKKNLSDIAPQVYYAGIESKDSKKSHKKNIFVKNKNEPKSYGKSNWDYPNNSSKDYHDKDVKNNQSKDLSASDKSNTDSSGSVYYTPFILLPKGACEEGGRKKSTVDRHIQADDKTSEEMKPQKSRVSSSSETSQVSQEIRKLDYRSFSPQDLRKVSDVKEDQGGDFYRERLESEVIPSALQSESTGVKEAQPNQYFMDIPKKQSSNVKKYKIEEDSTTQTDPIRRYSLKDKCVGTGTSSFPKSQAVSLADKSSMAKPKSQNKAVQVPGSDVAIMSPKSEYSAQKSNDTFLKKSSTSRESEPRGYEPRKCESRKSEPREYTPIVYEPRPYDQFSYDPRRSEPREYDPRKYESWKSEHRDYEFRKPDYPRPDYPRPDYPRPDYPRPENREYESRKPDCPRPENREYESRKPDYPRPDIWEYESRKPDCPRPEPREYESQKPDCPRPEPRKSDCPRPEPRQSDCPKPEPRKSDCPRPEPRKSDCPKPEPRKSDSPKPEPRKSDCPKPEPEYEYRKPEPPKYEPREYEPREYDRRESEARKPDPRDAEPRKLEPRKFDICEKRMTSGKSYSDGELYKRKKCPCIKVEPEFPLPPKCQCVIQNTFSWLNNDKTTKTIYDYDNSGNKNFAKTTTHSQYNNNNFTKRQYIVSHCTKPQTRDEAMNTSMTDLSDLYKMIENHLNSSCQDPTHKKARKYSPRTDRGTSIEELEVPKPYDGYMHTAIISDAKTLEDSTTQTKPDNRPCKCRSKHEVNRPNYPVSEEQNPSGVVLCRVCLKKINIVMVDVETLTDGTESIEFTRDRDYKKKPNAYITNQTLNLESKPPKGIIFKDRNSPNPFNSSSKPPISTKTVIKSQAPKYFKPPSNNSVVPRKNDAICNKPEPKSNRVVPIKVTGKHKTPPDLPSTPNSTDQMSGASTSRQNYERPNTRTSSPGPKNDSSKVKNKQSNESKFTYAVTVAQKWPKEVINALQGNGDMYTKPSRTCVKQKRNFEMEHDADFEMPFEKKIKNDNYDDQNYEMNFVSFNANDYNCSRNDHVGKPSELNYNPLDHYSNSNECNCDPNDRNYIQINHNCSQNERTYNQTDRNYNQNDRNYNQNDRNYNQNDRNYNQNDHTCNQNDHACNQNDRNYSQNDRCFNVSDYYDDDFCKCSDFKISSPRVNATYCLSQPRMCGGLKKEAGFVWIPSGSTPRFFIPEMNVSQSIKSVRSEERLTIRNGQKNHKTYCSLLSIKNDSDRREDKPIHNLYKCSECKSLTFLQPEKISYQNGGIDLRLQSLRKSVMSDLELMDNRSSDFAYPVSEEEIRDEYGNPGTSFQCCSCDSSFCTSGKRTYVKSHCCTPKYQFSFCDEHQSGSEEPCRNVPGLRGSKSFTKFLSDNSSDKVNIFSTNVRDKR